MIIIIFLLLLLCIYYLIKVYNTEYFTHATRYDDEEEIFIKPYLCIKKSTKGGYGVFTKKFIPKNTVVEIARTLIIKSKERDTLGDLTKYDFNMGDGTTCFALGFGGMYNHSFENNVEYSNTYSDNFFMHYTTNRNVNAGEELCVNYGSDYFTTNNLPILY